MGGDYQPGQEAFYHEEGEVDKVTVVKNNSDSEWERYVLRVEEVVRTNDFFKPAEIGETFRCDKTRGVSYNGLWHLSDHA